MRVSFVTIALLFTVASARPRPARRDVQSQNIQDAINQNKQFASLNANSPCKAGEDACIGTSFAQCVSGKFVVQACAPGTICSALPLTNAAGTTITCTTEADRDQRLGTSDAGGNDNNNDNNNKGNNNAGNGAAAGNDNDAQDSLTLDPAVLATGFEDDGQDQPTAGQVASLTSKNNFINFCKTVSFPITNGQQIKTGSCNPAPMGVIPSTQNMPSSKFVFPPNGGKVAANTAFTIKMAIQNMETGNFVNANKNYFSAPQQLNGQGQIQGHSHVVIEKLDSLGQTTPTDPNVFAFFKGLNAAAAGGVLTADVDKGLPAGAYRLASINTAANHQPVLVPIAQHGSLDDAVYFTVA